MDINSHLSLSHVTSRFTSSLFLSISFSCSPSSSGSFRIIKMFVLCVSVALRSAVKHASFRLRGGERSEVDITSCFRSRCHRGSRRSVLRTATDLMPWSIIYIKMYYIGRLTQPVINPPVMKFGIFRLFDRPVRLIQKHNGLMYKRIRCKNVIKVTSTLWVRIRRSGERS